MQNTGGPRKAEGRSRGSRVEVGGRPIRALGGIRFAGQANDLDRADDPACVLAVYPVECRRISLGEFAEQIRQWRRFQFGADDRIGGRRFAQTVQERFEVKACPAAEYRRSPSTVDVRKGFSREPGESRGVKRLGQFHDIN